jgi:hypothetical protein
LPLEFGERLAVPFVRMAFKTLPGLLEGGGQTFLALLQPATATRSSVQIGSTLPCARTYVIG